MFRKKKKSLLDELFLHFSAKVQNLAVFSFMYMIRIRFFWARGINSEIFSGGTVMRLMRLLTSGAGGLILLLLMLVVTCLVLVGVGILLFWSCIASSLPSVNHDDCEGTAPDPLVWSACAPKRRRLVHAVRNYALLLGPAFIWTSDWVILRPSAITAEDVGAWPYSVGILVKWVTFLGTLHWPAAGADLRVGGGSYVKMLLLCELGLVRGLSWRELFQGIVDQVANFSVGCSCWSRH